MQSLEKIARGLRSVIGVWNLFPYSDLFLLDANCRIWKRNCTMTYFHEHIDILHLLCDTHELTLCQVIETLIKNEASYWRHTTIVIFFLCTDLTEGCQLWHSAPCQNSTAPKEICTVHGKCMIITCAKFGKIARGLRSVIGVWNLFPYSDLFLLDANCRIWKRNCTMTYFHDHLDTLHLLCDTHELTLCQVIETLIKN